MTASKRPLKDRVEDVIPPVDGDVVEYFLTRGILPITKVPYQMSWDPTPGREAEAFIAAKMNDYWLHQAYLAFPEQVTGHIWALMRAVGCMGRHKAGDGSEDHS